MGIPPRRPISPIPEIKAHSRLSPATASATNMQSAGDVRGDVMVEGIKSVRGPDSACMANSPESGWVASCNPCYFIYPWGRGEGK